MWQTRTEIWSYVFFCLIWLPFIKTIAFSACHRRWTPNWQWSRPLKKFWSFSTDFDNIELFLLKTNTPRGFWAFGRQRNFIRHRNCTITNTISIHFRYSLSIKFLAGRKTVTVFFATILHISAVCYWLSLNIDMKSFETVEL